QEATLPLFLEPLDLVSFEFDRRFAAEHGDEDFDLAALFVYLADFAFKVFEWAVDDGDGVAFGEVDGMTHGVACGATKYLVYLFRRERDGLIGRADEAGDLRRVAHDAPCFIGGDHVYEHIAGESLFFYF